jgi:hypothetical protein
MPTETPEITNPINWGVALGPTEVQRSQLSKAVTQQAETERKSFLELVDIGAENFWLHKVYEQSDAAHSFEPDAEGPPPTDEKELLRLSSRFSKELVEDILDSNSMEEKRFKVQRAENRTKNLETLGAHGLKGFGAMITAAVADPVLLPLFFVPYGHVAKAIQGGKAVTAAQRASQYSSRYAQYAKSGLIVGTAEGTAIATADYMLRPDATANELMMAMVLSGGLGAGLGTLQARWAKDIDYENFLASQTRLTPAAIPQFTPDPHIPKNYAVTYGPLSFTVAKDGPKRAWTLKDSEGVLLQTFKSKKDATRYLKKEYKQKSGVEEFAENTFESQQQRLLASISPTDLTEEVLDSVDNTIGKVAKNPMDFLGIREKLSVVVNLGRSDNVLIREMATNIALVSGHTTGTGVLRRAASIEKQLIEDTVRVKFYRAYANADALGRNKADHNEALTRYIRGDKTVNLSPSAKKAAENYAERMAELSDLSKKAGMKGMEDVQGNPNYVSRILDIRKIESAIAKYGEKGVRQGLSQLIIKANVKLTQEQADRIAKGYFKTAKDQAYAKAFSKNDRTRMTEDILADAMRREGVDDATIDRVTLGITKQEGRKPTDLHARRRLAIDEVSSVSITGKNGEATTFRFDELLDNDIERIFNLYTGRMGGGIALARKGIDSDEAFEVMIKNIETHALKKNLAVDKTAKEIDQLRYLYDMMRGRFGANETTTATTRQNLRLLREFNFIRLMGMAGVSASIEFANVVIENGLKGSFRAVPEFKTLFQKSLDGQLANPLMRDLEYSIGGGVDMVTGNFVNRFDDEALNVAFEARQRTLGGVNVDEAAGKGRRFVSVWGGLAPVTTALQRLNTKLFAENFHKVLTDVNNTVGAKGAKLPVSSIKLRQLGLDNAMLARIQKGLRDKSVVKVDDKGNLQTLNVDKWADQEAADAFKYALKVDTNQNVQVTNIGSTNPFLKSEWGKTLFQFWNFVIGSNEQQFARNWSKLQHGDFMPAKVFMGACVMGYAQYALRTHLNAVGKSDPDGYISKRMSTEAVAKGVLSYYGGLGVMSVGFGYNGFSPAGIMNNPSAQLAEGAYGAVTGLPDIGEWSEQEWRKNLGLLGPQNIIGMNQMLNALSAGLGD